MMKIRLSLIVDYAGIAYEQYMSQAVEEFFGEDAPSTDQLANEQTSALFSEWLIYDFKLPSSGSSIAGEYYLKNPDELEQPTLEELKEILETQQYDLLEIVKINAGKWIEAYSFAQAKVIRIWEKSGSMGAQTKTTITGRTAKIRGRWYLVGSDGIQLPFSSSTRHKRNLRKMESGFEFTPHDALGFIMAGQVAQNKKVKIYTRKEIKNKRKELEKNYNRQAEKYEAKVEFRQIVEFVYEENYQSNQADMFKDLMKLGIPEQMMVDSVNLFQDIWNFFPHKRLKGKSPTAAYQERYQTTR